MLCSLTILRPVELDDRGERNKLEEQRFLVVVANQIALAIDDALNFDRLRLLLELTNRAQILQALEEANGVVVGPNGAAARLGMKRSTLQVRIQKLGIRIARVGSQESRSGSR